MIYVSTSCLKGENSRFTKDVFKVLEVYRKNDINNIELGSVHSYIKDLTKIKKYQKENDTNFIIHGFFPPAKKSFYLNFASKNKKVLKESIKVAKNAIELCNDLNSNLYSTHAGFSSDKIGFKKEIVIDKIAKDKARDIAAYSFSNLCDYAANYDIKIAVENNQGSIGIIQNIDCFKIFFKKVNVKNLGALIDIGHAAVAKIKFNVDLKKMICQLKNKIFEIHIHKSVNGKDTHLNIDSPDLLKDFDKDTLKKTALTLEAINLTPNEILKGKNIIKQALN